MSTSDRNDRAARMKGVLSPVVTPFKADLSPDPERFVRQCRWLLSQDVGLAVFGTNSEANSLSTEEKVELLASVWGYAARAGTRTVDVHVAQVRAKLGEASPIRTVRGVGYAADA